MLVSTLLLANLLQFASASQDFAKIRTQAQFSNDTYLAADEIEKILKQQNQNLVHQATIPESQVSYFLSESKGVQTIAIRGTANLENAMMDLDIELQPDAKLDILLHKGFASGARAVYKDIKPYIDADKPVQITGHSLGGAIAVVLAMYLTQDDYRVTQVITFGQPKVTNVTGAGKFASLPLIRVVTPKDLVPLVPPISPLQIKDLDIYWHMGEEVILLGDHQFSQTSGLKSMLRATKFTSSIPNENNIMAHLMQTYLDRIDELLNSADEIPYKMEINLFGLSIE